ncbi:MAG: hypothetical protein AMXMBFR36_15010 [Acidobacteriota bacterium]
MSSPASAFRIVACLGCLALPGAPPLCADDGDLDPSFAGGAFTLAWTAGHARASVLEPIPGGELLVGGTVGDAPGEIDGWAVAKLEADGSRDLLWSLAFQIVSAGDETMAITDELCDLGRDGAGRTILAGAADAGIDNHVPMLARLTPTGALDASFDGNGIRLVDDAPAAWTELRTHAAAVLPDGRTVFAGRCGGCGDPENDWAWVARRLADGSADTSFSGDGWLSFRFDDTGTSAAVGVAVDEADRITVAGRRTLFTFVEAYLVRLTPAGTADGSFGGGDGMSGPWGDLPARGLALDPSSGRIATGTGEVNFAGEGRVEVFTAAGDPDPTFSGDGIVSLDLEEGTSIHAVAFQSDGKLLAVGTIDANGANQGGLFLARMTKAGALDATFDDNGVKRVEFDAAANVADGAFAVTTMGGRLVAAGYAGAGGGANQEFAVVRTESALLFSDGFERGSTGGWSGQ